MPEVQRSDSLRSAPEGEALLSAGKPSSPAEQTNSLPPVLSVTSASGGKPAERSVSFNRDVHVKRIGRGTPRVSAALTGDGEGRLIATPVRKERITSRSKEDLAQEAALVLQQAGSLRCVAHDNKSLPGKFSTLPARRNKKRPELPLNVRRKSEEIGATIPGDDLVVAASKPTTTTTTSTTKKKTLERSHSDASAKRLKGPLAKFFSPKLERRSKPVTRSVSDAGASAGNRKRSGSESEGSHLSVARAKKQLSPIIEASPRVDESQQPFNFGKKSKREPEDSPPRETSAPELVGPAKPPRSPRRRKDKVDGEAADGKAGAAARSAENGGATGTVDEVDDTMIHSSRYDQPARHGEESTIHKMIHRLSNDRSPPPQLTRAMVSPGPGFGHNNNRPFSYTRPNESSPPPPPNSAVIYAQVQMDKKKAAAQRSHSDSDEGLGLDRKDSSRENSPADKDYLRRTEEYSSYNSDLRRKNELNSIDSRCDDDRKNVTHFGDFSASRRNDEGRRPHDFDDKHTSTVFVDASARGRADGMDARRRDSLELSRVGRNERATGMSSKTDELSARRDLLESRIKSRLLADEMFFAAKKNGANVPRQVEHEIVEKPVVPPPVTPNRVASPKRYTDTYISETRTSSNGDKYIFEKEMHEDNGKVYGYEKKITNKIPSDGRIDAKPRDGYTVETRTDKYGDKYLVETRTHEGYTDDFRPFLSDRSRTSPEERFRAARASNNNNNKSSGCLVDEYARCNAADRVDTSPIVPNKFSKSEDFLDRDFSRAHSRDVYPAKTKQRAFDTIRGMSKSTQRLDEVGENLRVRALRGEYTTRSHENLSTADYANASELRRRPPPLASSPVKRGVVVVGGGGGGGGCSSSSSPFVKRHLPDLRERPNDDYDTDISQMTSSQLDSKCYRESTTRTTHRYKHALRYDSDATARDSSRYHSDEPARCKPPRDDAEPKKPARRSRDNRPDYFDDSDARDSSLRGKTPKGRLETFDESPPGSPPRDFHRESESSSSRRNRHHETRHRETRVSDPDRKDRLADSGIENDYRRDSQEVDRREPLESEDEGFATMQFIKRERRHTDRNMGLRPDEKRRFDKYVANGDKPLAALPPTGVDKKYEKKAAKKSGTMSRVKQLFSKREKKVKEEEDDEEEEEKNKKKKKKKKNPRGSSGALTDDEVTMRYREYKGDQLRSAKSARDLDSDVNREDYSRRRRLSTPSGSPSPPRPARLSRSTGTLTREEEPFCESSHTLTRENQGQEAERKGWFKSLSRKNKSNVKPIDKKQRIPESEILTTGTEDEEASSAPERVSVQKNLRFFGDTDQESISSNRECRNKRTDDHTGSRRCDVSNASRQTSGIVSPPRKPPRLAESALSSGESTTGDSSQQSQNSQRSQRSVVYLHAATVGEIPGPNERRRAASREELNRPLQSQTRTVSRSVSVLAPWKPRHYREPFEINYDQQQHHHHQHHQQKPTATIRRRHRSRETLSRREKEARRSKDNLSKTGTISRSTLKSKDKQKVDRTVSTESLANKSRNGSSRPELSRSTSVPRDPNKSAGWFKLKSKKSRS